jgi:hypothetical protein
VYIRERDDDEMDAFALRRAAAAGVRPTFFEIAVRDCCDDYHPRFST